MSPIGSFFDSFCLNFDLFNIDGKPLEFSLDGYGLREFMRITTIVKAFGGKLSNRHAPNTTVFSHPNYVSKLSCTRYNIKFLEDSIRAQQLPNLENYRITSSEGWQLNSCVLQNAPGSGNLDRDPKIGLSQMCMRSFGSENNDNESSQYESDQGPSVTKNHERILKNFSVSLVRIPHKPQSPPEKQEYAAKNIIHSVNNNGAHEIVKVKPNVIRIPFVKEDRGKVFFMVEPSKDFQDELRMNNELSRTKIAKIALPAPNDFPMSPRSIDFKSSRMENKDTRGSLLNGDVVDDQQKVQSCGSLIDNITCNKRCEKDTNSSNSDKKILTDAELCNESDSATKNDSHEITKAKPDLIKISLVRKNLAKVFSVVEPSKDFQDKLRMYTTPIDIQKSPNLIDFKVLQIEDKHTEKLLLDSNSMDDQQNVQSCGSLIDNTKCHKSCKRDSNSLASCQHQPHFNVSNEKIVSDAESSNDSYTNRQFHELKNSEISFSSNPTATINAFQNKSTACSKMSAHNSDDDDNANSDNDDHDGHDDNDYSDDSDSSEDSHNNHDNQDYHQTESLVDETTYTAARVRILRHKSSEKVNELKCSESTVTINCADDSRTNQKGAAFLGSIATRVSTSDAETSKSAINDEVSSASTISSISESKRFCATWSEEENKFVINFLIDNNAIRHRMRSDIWEKCLQASPLLQECRRTMGGIRAHFYRYLRQHYYKYINDPKALRTFELTKHRPVKKIERSIKNNRSRILKSARPSNIKMSRLKHKSRARNLEKKIFLSDSVDEQLNKEYRNESFNNLTSNKKKEKIKLSDCDSEIHCSNSEEMELSDGEQCNENSIQQLTTTTIADDDNSADVRRKKSTRNDNNGYNLLFNKTAHTAARIRIYKKEIFKNIVDIKSNQFRRSECNDDDLIANQKGSGGLHAAEKGEAPMKSFFSRKKMDRNFTSHGTKQQRSLMQERGKHIRYTEEENRRMIQYLINSNKIHAAHMKNTWRSYLAAEGLNGPKRTAAGLTDHCERHLMNKYERYTNDPVALEKLAKHASRKWGKVLGFRHYSQDEDQCIINFLINNQLIHRATSRRIWMRADLHANPIFRKMKRTPTSLRYRFVRYLRYNYAEYTNNPEALKQFKEMEIKRPNHGHRYKHLK